MGTMGVAKLIKKPTTLLFLGGLRVKKSENSLKFIYNNFFFQVRVVCDHPGFNVEPSLPLTNNLFISISKAY